VVRGSLKDMKTPTRTETTLVSSTPIRTKAAAAVMAAILPLTACQSAPTAQSPAASSSAPASVAPAPDRFNQQALDILNAVVRGDWNTVTAPFDPQMRQQLPAAKLCSAWSGYQQQFGNYQSHGDPQPVTRGDLTVVNVPLQMERMPGEFRITFDSNGAVGGLWLLRAGVPVP
jgi:hypothetical protein